MNSNTSNHRENDAENEERDAAIAEVTEFLQCCDFSIEQIMAIHAFACALITGGVNPGFFSLIADAFQVRGDPENKPWHKEVPKGWASKDRLASQ